jgi:hypothetical protein
LQQRRLRFQQQQWLQPMRLLLFLQRRGCKQPGPGRRPKRPSERRCA